MIKIIIDINNYYKDIENELILQNFENYVNNYKSIIKSIESNTSQTIIVKNNVIAQWLKRIKSWYNEAPIELEKVTPIQYLEGSLDVEVPDYITEQDVLGSGIIGSDLSSFHEDSFEAIILSKFFSPLLSTKTFPFNRIVDIIKNYDETTWDNNLRNPIANKVFNQKTKEWIENESDINRKYLIKRFENSIQGLINLLKKYKVLRAYPKIGDQLLGNDFAQIDKLNLNLDGLEIDPADYPNIIREVEYYLNDINQPNNTKEYIDIINSLSGNLSIEFDKIEEIGKRNNKLLTKEVIKNIQTNFRSIKDKIQNRINALSQLIEPPFPAEPNTEWELEQILDWAIEEYFPYYHWVERNLEEGHDKLIKYSDIFSEWLFDNWENIKNNSKKLLSYYIPNHSFTSEDNKNDISIVLVIDNLQWQYVNFIISEFKEHGYNCRNYEPYLSLIPSKTEISKKCLLSGESNYANIDQKRYTKMVDDGWLPFTDLKNKFQYSSGLQSFLNKESLSKGTYFINYLPIDKNLHKNENELGMSYEKSIKFHLKTLIEETTDYLKTENLEKIADIYIISDHGSTKIPANSKNDLDPSRIKENQFTNIEPRLAQLSDKQFKNLTDNLRYDCFFINKNNFGIENNYICARRYNRFTNLPNDKYLHGSLSPEEMIVPSMHFSKVTEEINGLSVNLVKKQYRYRLETIELEIGNPNDIAVENIEITTLNTNIDKDETHITKIDPKTKQKIDFKARFKQTSSEKEKTQIDFKIYYEVVNEEYQQLSEGHEIEMKSMISSQGSDIFKEFE